MHRRQLACFAHSCDVLSKACKVSIDVKQGSQAALISGGVAACELAKQRIEEITLSVQEDIAVSDAL
jgi:hypothetical protein